MGIGAPMVAEEVLAYLSTIISVAYAGRLGGYNLGVFTLSHALTNITGIALLNGVTGAVDTFSSQAHGSRTFPAIGVVLQRALLLALLTCVPLMLLYWQALPVLLVLGQERALAAAAARYTRTFAGKIPLHAVALCLYRTLAAQGAAAHVLAASAVYCGVTAPINWALISWLGWGLDGSAAAAVTCEAVYVAVLAAACALHNAQQPAGQRWWHGWSGDALRDWGPFAKLSVSSTLMIVLDWVR
ncbi:MATE efflux family [Chlorella sorokiniana]|uniref:MATE efflux family n=1 Tax=Chlorella sorokiniana TaxID=3076 RepID=A0A2P6TL62_CHLSO|nr:MATE efflux family [Chlorella sorokiniana]|eukprot:PRW44986.1 MATE efflux family [Chlorella sorokiniana]